MLGRQITTFGVEGALGMSAMVSRAGLVGSVVALLMATCCILPLALVLLGLGGSWLAVFGAVAAARLYILGISAALTATGWFLAIRRRRPAAGRAGKAGSRSV